jgi:hypothetical protein
MHQGSERQLALSWFDLRHAWTYHLVKVVGLDLVQLLDDGRVVDRQAAELSQTLGGGLVLVHLDEVTGGLGKEEKTGGY